MSPAWCAVPSARCRAQYALSRALRAPLHQRFAAPLGMVVSSCAADQSTADVAQLRSSLDELPVVSSQVDTPPLHGYDDAPRAVDSDDPAIWVHPTQPSGSLVIGALKNAGLQVYTLSGTPIQTIVPPNHPPVSAQDPQVPGPQPDPGTSACRV